MELETLEEKISNKSKNLRDIKAWIEKHDGKHELFIEKITQIDITLKNNINAKKQNVNISGVIAQWVAILIAIAISIFK